MQTNQSGIGICTVMGNQGVDRSELLNSVLGRGKNDSKFKSHYSKGSPDAGRGLKMWSPPTYNEERGVFCIMMEL
jgi:hypothetical protein